MLTYVLEPGSRIPLYEQLYRAIKDSILSGVISGGEKLPSKRELAEHLNISRITVENAYSQLLAEGYIVSRPRSGYYAEVLEDLPQARVTVAAPDTEMTASAVPSASAGQFPFSVWAKLMRSVLLDRHDQLLLQPPNTGMAELRRAIAGLLKRSRGMDVSPDCIVIGAGAEYLYNILIQLLGRDRRYGLETPGHGKMRRIYEANAVSICPVELDESGVSLPALEQSGADVLHISPGHQFPTGIVTPIARRRQLMTWLSEGDRWIIEDDYDSEFRFSGRVIPTMHSMDDLGRVIYMNTFSRTITPALRISYMILPRQLMERYRQKLGFYSCAVPSFEQLTLARFLDEGYFEKHVARMKRRYRLLRDRLLTLLRQSPKASQMTVAGEDAGLHFLLKLQTTLPDEVLETQLAKAGVRAVSLSRYQIVEQEAGGSLVVQYSDLAEADLPRLIRTLEELTEEAT